MKDKRLMLKIVERLKREPGIILLHHNADIDALGSAIAMQIAFPGFSIGAFQNTNQMSKKFLTNFESVEILADPDLDQYETILILDTSSPSQLGAPDDAKNKILADPVVIDHHKSTALWPTEYYYCDESKSSCAEIVFELLELMKFNISETLALALLVAILTDTGHFKYANSESFVNFSRLLEHGHLKMTDVLDLVENNNVMEKSQRIAHLKGAQRLKFREVHGYLIAISQLSSFEASMCKQLLILGADVAFVGAQRDQSVRLSGRITPKLIEKGLHLGELFQTIGDEISCEGGGHAGAGGLNGIGDAEMVLNICMEKTSKILKML